MPNVSLCVQENEVHYNPWVEPPFFCKLITRYSVIEIEGSGELTKTMIQTHSHYDVLVSAEIGELCTSIGTGAFRDYKGLPNVTIGDSVTSIGNKAFYNCDALTSVTIGSSVETIGEDAFAGCRSLTSIDIPSSVTSIGNDAFGSCISLTSVTIPNSVTSIGNQSFEGCTGLTSVTVNATTPPTLGYYAFDNTSGCTIYVPLATVDAYKAATNWSTYASRIQAIPTT